MDDPSRASELLGGERHQVPLCGVRKRGDRRRRFGSCPQKLDSVQKSLHEPFIASCVPLPALRVEYKRRTGGEWVRDDFPSGEVPADLTVGVHQLHGARVLGSDRRHDSVAVISPVNSRVSLGNRSAEPESGRFPPLRGPGPGSTPPPGRRGLAPRGGPPPPAVLRDRPRT